MEIKKKTLPLVALALLISLMLLAPRELTMAQVRTGNLRIQYYSNPALAYGNLTAGNIDIMACPLSASQYATAITDPNIVLGPVTMNDMCSFDLNCNETIASQPGVNSPTSYWQFRAALAMLTDKPYIVSVICGGFAGRMDVPIQANAPSWTNASVAYPNYSWEFNTSRAAQMLDDAGFLEGSTPNPGYEPMLRDSAKYLRVYPQWAPVHDSPKVGTDVTGPPYVWPLAFPALSVLRVMGVPVGGHLYKDLPYTFASNTITVTTPLEVCTFLWIEYTKAHPNAGQDLNRIIFYARSDEPEMLGAAQFLRSSMVTLGLPVAFTALPLAGCTPQVMTAHNYHIYTGYQLLDRYPAGMYELYHSSSWFPDSKNYVDPPCPRPETGPSVIDPNYDIYLADIYYAQSIPEAIEAAKKAEGIHVMKVVNIPLWCTKSYYAWRSWVLGVVNEMGCGPINDYTFMNAYKCSGAPEPTVLRVGINQPPQQHNILYSQSPYDYALLDRYWERGQAVNPYDLGRDQPWVVQDWTPTTWIDPDDSMDKTACIYWLRKDVKWAAPVTGNYIRPFTAHDVEFSNMFSYYFDDGTHWNNVKDIDHIEILDDYSFKVYFSSLSYWFQYAANYPYLPKNEWGAQFCTPRVYTELGANYAGGSSLVLEGDGVAQVQSITLDGAPFTDYWVRFNSAGGIYSANRIYFKSAVSGNLVINYWSITKSAKGYYPGSATDWQSTSYSIGEYVMAQAVTNWTVFKRNDYFWLETPPLGEIDWYWWWDLGRNGHEIRDTTRPLGGPRMGTFVVDIYDVTYATVSYGSTGFLQPYPLGRATSWMTKSSFPDYATCGMPDFDQRQQGSYEWKNIDGRWSHCVPVSCADALWLLDSECEPNPTPPPFISDSCSLVQAYGSWDDHDPQNVAPLVEHLAWFMDCDGRRTNTPIFGTTVDDRQAGLAHYLSWSGVNPLGDVNGDGQVDQIDVDLVTFALGARPGRWNWNLAADVYPATTSYPPLTDNVIDENDLDLVNFNLGNKGSFFIRSISARNNPLFLSCLESEFYACRSIVVGLGFYQPGEEWSGGGHCVSMAGIDSTFYELLFSDPGTDSFENGGTPGRSPVHHTHPPSEPPYTTHNNASLVSQDSYKILFSPSPTGYNLLVQDYLSPNPSCPETRIEDATIISPLSARATAKDTETLWSSHETHSDAKFASAQTSFTTMEPPWFPGADLAPSYRLPPLPLPVPYGGEIDIYDVVTILVSYAQKFGEPPI